MIDPIMFVKNEDDLNSFLYGEKIDELVYKTSRGDRRAKAELVGELGEREFDRVYGEDQFYQRGELYK